MNIMARDELDRSISSVKEDPHLIVAQMRALEQALNVLREDNPDEQPMLLVLERLRRYFLAHLVEEERDFLPTVEALPEGEGKAARVRREHAELRQRVADFKSALTLAVYVGPQSRPSLLWRLVTEARMIIVRLKAHAAYEYDLVRELNGPVGNSHLSTAS